MTSTPMGFMFFFLSCKHRSAAANKYEQTVNSIVCKRSIVIYKNLALIKIASEARKFKHSTRLFYFFFVNNFDGK